MNWTVLFPGLLSLALLSCSQSQPTYLFYLHHKFVEHHGVRGIHPDYGEVEYQGIVDAFRERGLTVLSEVRPKDASVELYAARVMRQIDSLIGLGVQPESITILGASKGGYIAKHISSAMRNDRLKFVLVGCNNPDDPPQTLYGNILSIYEESDSLGRAFAGLADSSVGVMAHDCSCTKHTNGAPQRAQLRLTTEFKHGFLYRPLARWVGCAAEWARGAQMNPDTLRDLAISIDTLIERSRFPFSGVVLMEQAGRTVHVKLAGHSDSASQKPIELNDRFITGSISKQLTAAMILREYDRGSLKLDLPIATYLSSLRDDPAGRVTVHQLLTHTHGLQTVGRSDSLIMTFKPGEKFEYSQVGYKLLADIISAIHHSPFEVVCEELFREAGMLSTFAPTYDSSERLTTAFEIDSLGHSNVAERMRGIGNFAAAAGIASTAPDLARWNRFLHEGKMLTPATYKLMTTVYAQRDHSVLGATNYGYGLMVRGQAGHLQLGQTGAFEGYSAMNFYFPSSRTSIIVLQNRSSPDNLSRAFFFTRMLDWMKERF